MGRITDVVSQLKKFYGAVAPPGSVERRDAAAQRLHVFDDALVIFAGFVIGGLRW